MRSRIKRQPKLHATPAFQTARPTSAHEIAEAHLHGDVCLAALDLDFRLSREIPVARPPITAAGMPAIPASSQNWIDRSSPSFSPRH